MGHAVDWNRRRFLGAAGLTIAAAHFGLYRVVNGRMGGPKDLEAIGRATDWLNSPPLAASGLAGKVVLVQFWTYTCINWLRTLPYVRAWAEKYGPRLVVIGVHTPEFGFEHDVDNVRRAVRQMQIPYPVVLDGGYAIWRAFSNNYWPALYFIDTRGRVRSHHFGEGQYEQSERTIQRLLTESGVARSDTRAVAVEGNGAEAAADWRNLRSPETYVGGGRAENFASAGGVRSGRRHLYTAPERLGLNQWALAGEWTMGKEATVLNGPGGRIRVRFHARDVHLVMGPPRGSPAVRFRVSLDGQPPGRSHGVDTDEAGNGLASEQRLHQLIRQPVDIVDRTFEVEFLDAGIETFAFTFG
ncbi:MAG TPA: twin-arginine translocation signal domain-containing protein [Vicinamibacterales bacterium]|nr:twin-arginine translocation signal domain-containing protein [Vicinamibacterales bacterium]